ncbi:DUF2752 domain-containing protein [Paludisphaera rhizosphaerae]|uniref:DUF2752 domain-containing protein n=1 Tax=Paludisphaera rhizosphaerae TaxID=2711216 RepID=UPI0013EDAF27|nr:DUF2752 domain-containing protein [Paludisphaera rhizosphaerae]
MNQHPPSRPLSQPVRWSFAALAVGLMVMLAIGRSLKPDPRGYGSHERLGLAPCSYLASTGRFCPFCGATTAVAETTRGRLVRAWRANPAGALLGVLAGPLVVWLMLGVWTRLPIGFRSPGTPLVGLLFLLVLVGSAFWLMRFLDGPADMAPAGAAPVSGPTRPTPEPRKEGAANDPPYDDEDATSLRPRGGLRPAADPRGLRPADPDVLPPAL